MKQKIAGQDRVCVGCRATIPKGTVYAVYRERALSHREAFERGGYPERKICLACAEGREAMRCKPVRAIQPGK